MTFRILRGVGGRYRLHGEDGTESDASPRGLFRRNGQVPTPGDLVECRPSGDPDMPWRMERILPRNNLFLRPPLANLDMLLLIFSMRDPLPDLLLLDKLLILCGANRVNPVICVTKCDLAEEEAVALARIYRAAGYPVTMSRLGPDRRPDLDWLPPADTTIAMAGPSGSGKSTLMNHLTGEDRMEIGTVSRRIGRGRHTTRHVELIPLPGGGYLADTPGFSALTLSGAGVAAQQVVAGYPEFATHADRCRFLGCHHVSEPECAVRKAAEAGLIDPGRLSRYRAFRLEADFPADRYRQ